MDRWLKIREAGERTGLGRMTLYRAIQSGDLKASDIRPRGAKKATYRIAESAIEDYMRRHLIQLPTAGLRAS